MSLSITQRPRKSIDGMFSSWNGTWRPLVFKFHRIDIGVINTVVDTVNFTAVINLAGTFAGNIAGQIIYLKSSQFDGEYTVISNTTTTITINTKGEQLPGGAGYVNFNELFANYRIEIRVLKLVDNAYEVILTAARFKPDVTGRATTDLRAWLASLLSQDNDFDYDKINERDLNYGGAFNIQYRAVTSVFEELFQDPNPIDLHFFGNVARQIQLQYGNNLGEFVPFNNATLPEADKAKFLTDFNRPTYFEGYPFDLGFMI